MTDQPKIYANPKDQKVKDYQPGDRKVKDNEAKGFGAGVSEEIARVGSDFADPARVAVALGYDVEHMNAPQVLAAGKGHIAQEIVDIARENNISVQSDPMLAEALSKLELGQEIPPELYKVVAEILVFIMETDRKYRQS